MRRITAFLVLSVFLIINTAAKADKDSRLEPTLAKPGAELLTDSFDRGELGSRWAVAKGDWRIVDGAVVGKELKSDQHAAVLSCQRKNHNSILRFSFKLDGTDGFNLSLNHAKGHLFRVIVTPQGLAIRTDKDKKDPNSKSELLGEAKGSFEQGKWYTMLVEMVGDRVAVQTDNGLKAEGQHAGLDVDKPNYRFVTRGESLRLDDVRIWSVKE